MVTCCIVDNTHIDVSQEFSSNVCNFLMLGVELDSLLVVLWFCLSHLHVINSTAIVSKSFSMDITNCLANLQELFILVNREFVFSKIIIEYTC